MTTTRPKLFTVDEYYQMSALSILPADERTELLDGEILLMAAKNPLHSAITNGKPCQIAMLELSSKL